MTGPTSSNEHSPLAELVDHSHVGSAKTRSVRDSSNLLIEDLLVNSVC
jgi:hypothetical protein